MGRRLCLAGLWGLTHQAAMVTPSSNGYGFVLGCWEQHTWEKLRKKELHSSCIDVHTMDIENVVSWLGATTAHRCSTCRP